MEEHKEHFSAHIEKEEVKIKKIRIWQTLTVIFAVLFILSATTDIFNSGNDDDDLNVPTNGDDGVNVPKKDVSIDDDAVLGSKNAKITIVEFSDYQCSYCAKFYNEAFQQIKKEYIDTGKVRFVYRDFPLSFHQNAQKSAEASECAHEQGKFWEMNEKIFQNQNSLDVNSLKGYAKDLGLDTKEFDNCLDSGKMAKEVAKDFADGGSYGVSGTPAFFINGQLLTGAQPFSAFKSVIDGLL